MYGSKASQRIVEEYIDDNGTVPSFFRDFLENTADSSVLGRDY